MIKQQIFEPSSLVLQSSEPLSVMQLSLLADEILLFLQSYRPEFALIANLHRKTGCRVHELFEASRWQVVNGHSLQITPQKRNAVRLIELADIGFADAAALTPSLNDIGRLPERQYERTFSAGVLSVNLWRLYENGFARPSTHFFRHLRIKELSAAGFDKSFIATWIGEKNEDNLDYYLNSQYFV